MHHHGNVFHWAEDQPSGYKGQQRCAYVGWDGYDRLDDERCDYNYLGLCEIKIVDCDRVDYYYKD